MPRDMEKEQLEGCFREYYMLLLRVAFTELKSHADAEDVVQEVFLRFLKNQPDFAGKEHEKAWLLRTTINLCRDVLKSKWHKTTVAMDKVPEAEKEYWRNPYIEENEVLWAVLELPERYRRPLYLFYYEDYSIREIAGILDMPENTVKTNLKRGREKLKEKLYECKPE